MMRSAYIIKLVKLAGLLRNSSFRSALLRHRVAAATEHLDAIRFCAPATLLDVGANKGQFSTAVRMLFPKAIIEAFEPLPSAAERFAALFAGNPQVTLNRIAIGSAEKDAIFYVTDREDSSSLLPPGVGQKAAFGVTAVDHIEVQVRPLEKVIDLEGLPHPVMLKIDVQGAELDVLRGISAFDYVDFIYVELSFVELYDGQALFEDVRSHLVERGFTLRGVFNQVYTEQYGPTQADCLFARAI